MIADGLSALAPAHHALEVLLSLRQGLGDWQLDDIVVASQPGSLLPMKSASSAVQRLY